MTTLCCIRGAAYQFPRPLTHLRAISAPADRSKLKRLRHYTANSEWHQGRPDLSDPCNNTRYNLRFSARWHMKIYNRGREKWKSVAEKKKSIWFFGGWIMICTTLIWLQWISVWISFTTFKEASPEAYWKTLPLFEPLTSLVFRLWALGVKKNRVRCLQKISCITYVL